jgi:hypothetical protein
MQMQCPVCGQHSPPKWLPIDPRDEDDNSQESLQAAKLKRNDVWLDWMRCSNEECEQLMVRVIETRAEWAGHVPLVRREEWLARPRFGEVQRSIDPLVGEPFRTDYQEAAAILDMSHRMSAVLARKILGDLLKRYAGQTQNSLTAQIDGFTGQPGHPARLTQNLHHFREVGDFAAHTQETSEPEPAVIDVSREEAEWTLDHVDRLFEYFIVQPAKDEAIKASMDEKIKQAGRRPLRPSDDEGTT